MPKLPISVILLTLNEEHYLPGLLQNVQPWVTEVFIVDSLSTDRTVDIALEHGATVVQRPFTDFGDQWNWALKRLPVRSDWTMKLDPDERIPALLWDEIASVVQSEASHNAYRFRRRLWFMGQPLRQKAWVLRLWRTGTCRFSSVLVNEHPIIDGKAGNLGGIMEHLDSPNLHHWFDKQNFYSTMRALEMVRGEGYAVEPRLWSRDALQRRMFFKRLFFSLPFRHWLMWWYLALRERALFDGKAGRTWNSMRVQVYRWAEQKAWEMRRTGAIPKLSKRRVGQLDPRVAETDLQQRLLSRTEESGLETAAPSDALGKRASPAPPPRGGRKLQVAVNAVSMAPGGGMVVLLGYLQGWRDMGYPVDPTVYISRSSVRQQVEEQFPEIRVIPFAMDLPSAHHFLHQRFKLGGVLAEHGAEVVLTTNAMLGRCNVPQLVLHQNLKRFRTSRFFGQMRSGGLSEAIRDVAAREALRHAQANVFISHYLKNEAERVVPTSVPRNHVIYNGVPQHLIDRSQQVDDTPVQPGQLLALQAPAEHKDTPTLFRMLARLIEVRPEVPWRLKLAGDGDWSSHRRLAEELGVDSRIDYLGYLDHSQLAPLFRSSLCLVFASRLEGFGLPPLEAMARRCPSISCNATALPEVVGDAGMLVDPGDEDGFAHAVLRLHDEPELRKHYIEKGVCRIRQFNWATSAQHMTEVLYYTSVMRARK